MNLVEEYKRQHQWRDWDTVYAALPLRPGCTVLDLGCGVGDQAADLTRLGATVIGIDADSALIAAARQQHIPGATFHISDLRHLDVLDLCHADGIWISFTAAYFPDLTTILPQWSSLLKPGGWITLVEIDDLLGHSPLSPSAEQLIAQFYADSLRSGHYDFCMGRKLAFHLRRSGCHVSLEKVIADDELSFQGPARPEILQAWENRLARMKGLRRFAGEDFEAFRSEFLALLMDPRHQSKSNVNFVLGYRAA